MEIWRQDDKEKVESGQRIEDRQNVIPVPYVIPAKAGIQKKKN